MYTTRYTEGKSMRILAIDPGSKHLGYAHMKDEHIVMSGTLDLWGDSPRTRTTLFYWCRFQLEGIKLDSGRLWTPEHMMLESYYAHNQRGANIIPELRGIIKLAANQLNVPILEVGPGTVKKHVTGYGRSDKATVRKAINEAYGLSIKSTDQADAIAIGLTGLWKLGDI